MAERLPAEVEGAPFAVGLNVRFLLEGLKATPGEAIAIRFAHRRTAVRIEAAGDSSAFCAIMPLNQF